MFTNLEISSVEIFGNEEGSHHNARVRLHFDDHSGRFPEENVATMDLVVTSVSSAMALGPRQIPKLALIEFEEKYDPRGTEEEE